ncbi:MAG: DUF6435 family protein [Saprospiraceae bacterium]|nr:DUF6435 family protein [Saprospiraceae bacterium]
MFGIFKKNPARQLEKEIARKQERARDVQRSGDLRAYARLMEEIERLEDQLNNA